MYDLLKQDTDNFVTFTKQNPNVVDKNFAKEVENSRIEKIKTIDALYEPFDPESNMCSYDRKVIKRIKELASDSSNKIDWLPNDLKAQLNFLPDEITLADKASINVTLFSINVYDSPSSNNGIRKTLRGSNQYTKFNPEAFSDTQANSFLFSLDCSGYLTSTISAGAGFSGAELKSAGQTALSSKKSAIVVRSLVYSPIAISLDPSRFPEEKTSLISKRDRLEIIYSIISEVNDMPSTAMIKFPNSLDLLWTSNQGDSSFQGAASVSASGGASFGFGKVEGAAQAGLDVSRRSKYSNFKTHLVTEEQGDKKNVSDIKLLVKKLTEEASTVSNLEQNIKGDYIIAYDLPKYICEDTVWKVKVPVKGALLDAGSISRVFEKDSGCRFTVGISKTAEVLTNKGFVVTGTNEKWSGETTYPIKIKK